MRFAQKAEGVNGVVHWSDKDDSFVIENVHEFEKILPKYFNTRNFSSFVRQLNMYEFQKRRNLHDFHEFYHVNFSRKNPELIELIRRKSNHSLLIHRSEYSHNTSQNSLAHQIIELNCQIASMRQAREQLQVHNKYLAEMNKELFINLSLSKGFSFAKMQKLLIIFFVLLEDYNPRCVYGVKMEIFRSNISPNKNNLEMFDLLLRVKNFFGNFFQQMNDPELMSSEYLDKIFDIFCAHIADKNKGRNFETFRPYFNEIAQMLNTTNMSELLLNEKIGIQEVLEAHSKNIYEMKDHFTSQPLLSSNDHLNFSDSQSVAFSWVPSIIKAEKFKD